MKKILLCLFVAACFASCSNNDENASIQLTGNTTTSQTVYADETSKPEGIKFTATAPWTAMVKNVTTTRSSEVDWLTLNLYSGDAGEYTLTMTLQPNLTGKDRVAKIVITCGDTVIRIRVEQKGTKANGEKPEVSKMRFVDNIVCKWEDAKDDWRQEITEFTYNLDGTVKQNSTYGDFNNNNIIDADERRDGLDWKTEFTYDAANKKVHTKFTEYNEKTHEEDYQTGELILNAEGYVTKASYKTNDNGTVETYHISYQNGHVISVEATKPDSDSKYIEKPEWQNNNLVKITCGSGTEQIWGNSEVTYGEELNRPDVSIDLNFIIANTEWLDCFCEDGNYGLKVCDFFGKRSKNMMVKEKSHNNADSQVHEYSHTYGKDAEGFINKITVDNNNGGPQSNANAVYIINYKK